MFLAMTVKAMTWAAETTPPGPDLSGLQGQADRLYSILKGAALIITPCLIGVIAYKFFTGNRDGGKHWLIGLGIGSLVLFGAVYIAALIRYVAG